MTTDTQVNQLAELRYALFGRLGDAWSSKTRGESLRRCRALIGLSRRPSSVDEIFNIARNFMGEQFAFQSGVEISYDPRQVASLGPDANKRVSALDPNGPVFIRRRPAPGEYDFPISGHVAWAADDPDNPNIIVQAESCEYILLPSPADYISVAPTQRDWLRQYLVPIPFHLQPLAIRSIDGRDLVHGVDFELGEGVIILRQHPDEIFRNRTMHVSGALARKPNLLNFTFAVEDFFGSAAPLANYVRAAQTPSNFLQAIARVCDLQIAPWDATVISITTDCHATYYEFELGDIRVDYPHRALTVGQSVTKGAVVGATLEIAAAGKLGDVGWWRALDWGNALSLDTLCPFAGLALPNTSRKAYVQDTGPDDYHVKIDLDGDADVQAKFWYSVQRSELLKGKYLNSVIGLSSPSDSKYVNPLELFFRYHLAQSAWIISRLDWSYWDGQRQKRFEQFVSREKPFSGILLVRDYAS